MISPSHVATVAVLAVALLGAAFDLKTRRVPNGLTLGAAAVAIAVHGAVSGLPGLLFAVSGWIVGLALFFPLFALKGMGAGDVKLLAAIGAWMGPWGAIWTGLYGAVAGGVLALGVVLTRGRLAKTAENLRVMFSTWRDAGLRPVEGLTLESSAGPRLPYALPLAVGALITLWIR